MLATQGTWPGNVRDAGITCINHARLHHHVFPAWHHAALTALTPPSHRSVHNSGCSSTPTVGFRGSGILQTPLQRALAAQKWTGKPPRFVHAQIITRLANIASHLRGGEVNGAWTCPLPPGPHDRDSSYDKHCRCVLTQNVMHRVDLQ